MFGPTVKIHHQRWIKHITSHPSKYTQDHIIYIDTQNRCFAVHHINRGNPIFIRQIFIEHEVCVSIFLSPGCKVSIKTLPNVAH